MTKPVFAQTRAVLTAAAGEGAHEAGRAFAETLRRSGENAAMSRAPDGAVQVHIEGAGLRAREFGTVANPSAPFLGPALQENRRNILRILAKTIGGALVRRRGA